QDMVRSMAANPIIFACANPTPEIMPDLAKAVRDDLIIGTGRSDFANQVNNVLGFPFIFRGALDVRATKITENMKMAASRALAALAKEPVPDYVLKAHNRTEMSFGPDYVIPSPFDKRLLVWVSSAVAQAAVEDGVARVKDFNLAAYKTHLQELANS
ncbi:MAG: malic enzyme-like NAD(P)-binding protein, partial [Sulfuricurvum sp.]